jgi:hypothetical protein
VACVCVRAALSCMPHGACACGVVLPAYGICARGGVICVHATVVCACACVQRTSVCERGIICVTVPVRACAV